MSGRHSAPPRRRKPRSSRKVPALVVVLPVVLGGAFVSTKISLPVVGGCTDSASISIAAADEIVGVLEDAASSLEEREVKADSQCVDFEVSAAAPTEVARALDAGEDSAPDLWVPDSSTWLERIDGFEGEPTIVADALGMSPVVVAGSGLHQPGSWREVLSRSDVTFVDPLRSSAPTAALLALMAESKSKSADRAVESVMVPLAQRLGGDPHAPQDVKDLALDHGRTAILSEQQMLDLQAQNLGKGLDVQVPKTGTMVLDYPLVALSDATAATEAGEHLAEYMRSSEGAESLEAAGFRDADLEALPEDRGAGAVRTLPAPEAGVVAELLRRWSLMTVPSSVLGVFDVSGSMDELAGRRTRITLASQVSADSLRMFPDQSRVGIWAFSNRLDGRRRDYRELVKIRRLDSEVKGKDQRWALRRALAQLPRLTNGGTGLYDTTLAAVRAVRRDYDKNAVNTIVLLTDGRNEDPGSISLKELVRTLWAEIDPDRPVPVIAIGIGPDADAHALRRIVGTTGGHSYIARNPADLAKVYEEALLSR